MSAICVLTFQFSLVDESTRVVWLSRHVRVIDSPTGRTRTAPSSTPGKPKRQSSLSAALVVFLATVVLAAAFLAVARMVREQYTLSNINDPLKAGQAEPIGWWIARDFLRQPKASNIVLFSNSQLGGLRAADAKAADKQLDFVLDHRSYSVEKALSSNGDGTTVFISSQPGSNVSDYYAMVNALFSDERKPELAVFALAPRDFMGNGLDYPGDSQYYRFFSRCRSAAELNDIAYPDWQSKFDSLIKETFDYQIPKVRTKQFVFLPADKQVYRETAVPYSSKNWQIDSPMFTQELTIFDSMLAILNRENVKVLVVLLPFAEPTNNPGEAKVLSLLQKKFQNHAIVNQSGQDLFLLDLSSDSRFNKADFLDPIHLSQNGGDKFAKIVAEFITVRKMLHNRTVSRI